MCGGTLPTSPAMTPFHGLSPRVRGNRLVHHEQPMPRRSIPACAGEPTDAYAVVGQKWVYPRVCGGTTESRSSGAGRQGLSPRVRGNPPAAGHRTGGERSIPACAGEPRITRTGRRPRGVYPRVCGGTPPCHASSSRASGLSPRVRGNPVTADTIPVIPGSIPACAGEPAELAGLPVYRRVYPRVCGGTSAQGLYPGAEQGLSPRVRGNPALYQRRAGRPRSIPACAGEPRRCG